MFSNTRLIDLTHALNSPIPTWTGGCGFEALQLMDYEEGARVQELHLLAGAGTHMDAPSHFIPGAKNIDQLLLQDLLAPLSVVDLSKEKKEITLDDFKQYEKSYGKIAPGSVVVGNTGWSQFWSDPDKYREGFPTFSEEVGDFLLERKIKGLGIDALSPDPRESGFPLHHQLLKEGVYFLENLTRLDRLPKSGAWILSLPLKIEGGTESPIRSIGLY